MDNGWELEFDPPFNIPGFAAADFRVPEPPPTMEGADAGGWFPLSIPFTATEQLYAWPFRLGRHHVVIVGLSGWRPFLRLYREIKP